MDTQLISLIFNLSGTFFILFVIYLLIFLLVVYDILSLKIEATEKILWIIVIYVLPIIGLIFYFIKREEIKRKQKEET